MKYDFKEKSADEIRASCCEDGSRSGFTAGFGARREHKTAVHD